MVSQNADLAFTDTGFNYWKKALEQFEQHNHSTAHREVVMKIDLLNSLLLVFNSILNYKNSRKSEEKTVPSSAYFSEVSCQAGSCIAWA